MIEHEKSLVYDTYLIEKTSKEKWEVKQSHNVYSSRKMIFFPKTKLVLTS